MTNIKRNLDWDCVLTGPAHPFPCQWMVTLCWSSSGRYQTKTIALYRTFTINYNMQDDHTYDDLHEDLSLSCLTFEFCWQRPLCASPHHSSISSSSPGLASSSSSFNLNQLASYHSGSFFKIKFFSCIPLFRQGSTGRLFSFGSLEEEEEE